MVKRVVLSRQVRKQLGKLPRHIVENLAAWVDDVENRGLEEARKVQGITMSRSMESGRDSGPSA